MSFRLFAHTHFFRYLMAFCLMIVLSICTACGDDDDQPSSNASRPVIIGNWADGFGTTLTISQTHFVVAGLGWGYSGLVAGFNTTEQYFVFQYTNVNSTYLSQDLINRYNLIRWKDFSVSGSTAVARYQEAYAGDMTNSSGDFIAWPTKEAAEAETNIGVGWSLITNANWRP